MTQVPSIGWSGATFQGSSDGHMGGCRAGQELVLTRLIWFKTPSSTRFRSCLVLIFGDVASWARISGRRSTIAFRTSIDDMPGAGRRANSQTTSLIRARLRSSVQSGARRRDVTARPLPASIRKTQSSSWDTSSLTTATSSWDA